MDTLDGKTVATLIVTIVLAMTGYGFTYWYNLKIARRKDRLDIVNRQLMEFYGPLFALAETEEIVYMEFRTKYRNETSYFTGSPPPTKNDLCMWRLWMKEVFMPIHERIEELIITKSALLQEEEMPKVLLDFMAHVSAFKAVIKRWEAEDFADYLSIVPYPGDIHSYARNSFFRIKAQQADLLGAYGIKYADSDEHSLDTPKGAPALEKPPKASLPSGE